MGTYHDLERAVNAGCQVTSRPRSGDTPLKEVNELYGAPQRCPPRPRIGHGQPCTKIRRVGVSAFPRPLGAARDTGPRVYTPSRKVVRSFQHAADMRKPFVESRNGCPHEIIARIPCRVVKSQTAVRTRCFCLFPRPPFYMLAVLALVHGLVHLRSCWPTKYRQLRTLLRSAVV